MNKQVLCVLIILLAGCDDEPKYRTSYEMAPACNADTVAARAEFTLQCIGNANPKSDEEPEDWIDICLDMAVSTYCELKSYEVIEFKQDGGYWEPASRKLVGARND
ncbi:MAG: hypothetical protein GY941_12820 [Planctomycetes bacterium]|nr:hypothetical protein [Planctomycetota bacterium]